MEYKPTPFELGVCYKEYTWQLSPNLALLRICAITISKIRYGRQVWGTAHMLMENYEKFFVFATSCKLMLLAFSSQEAISNHSERWSQPKYFPAVPCARLERTLRIH